MTASTATRTPACLYCGCHGHAIEHHAHAFFARHGHGFRGRVDDVCAYMLRERHDRVAATVAAAFGTGAGTDAGTDADRLFLRVAAPAVAALVRSDTESRLGLNDNYLLHDYFADAAKRRCIMRSAAFVPHHGRVPEPSGPRERGRRGPTTAEARADLETRARALKHQRLDSMARALDKLAEERYTAEKQWTLQVQKRKAVAGNWKYEKTITATEGQAGIASRTRSKKMGAC